MSEVTGKKNQKGNQYIFCPKEEILQFAVIYQTIAHINIIVL